MLAACCSAHPYAAAEAACERCGDFVCSLCTDLPETPLCARCAMRCTVAWEVRGEESLLLAFWMTWAEVMTSPIRVGRKLSGPGFTLAALSYVLTAAIVGGLPLALVLAALSARGADPLTLGLGSTSALSTSAAWVFGALSAATALVLFVLLYAGTAYALSRAFGASVPFAPILRCFAYGVSCVALPVVGPLLLLPSLLLGAIALHASVARRAGSQLACWVSGCTAAAFGSVCALAVWIG